MARRHASPRFLYYWLYNIKSAGFIDTIVGRTTIAHLTAEKLEALPWPDVPHREQERIAAYLDASCAAIHTVLDKAPRAEKAGQKNPLDHLRSARNGLGEPRGRLQHLPRLLESRKR